MRRSITAPLACSAWLLPFLAAACIAAGLTGCSGAGQLIGGMAASAERTGSHSVKTRYDGLAGKSYAVIVAADRAIQADHPEAVSIITAEVTRRVATGMKTAGVIPSGFVPAEDVLKFQGRRPGWVAMTPRQVATELGCQRLIYVDVDEYRLTDPGNRWVWNGVAAGTVSVVEAENDSVDEFAFREPVQVKFPDKENTGAAQIPLQTVQLALLKRFVDRCSWLFYSHDEANKIEY